jgi:hypothetical protein
VEANQAVRYPLSFVQVDTVVGLLVTPLQGTEEALVAFPTKLPAVIVPLTFAFPESQRSFHLLPVAPISLDVDVAYG